MSMSPEQFDKQPAYVRAEILSLRQENERLRAEAEWLRDENKLKVDASNVVVNWGVAQNKAALEPYSEIEFFLDQEVVPGRRRLGITVRIRRTSNVLEVRSDERLIVMPSSSNSVHITQQER